MPIRPEHEPAHADAGPCIQPARGITYREYMLDPDVMAQGILEWHYWMRFLLPGDHEKGLPDQWVLHVDFENTYDAAWFGAPVEFNRDQVPYAAPLLNDDNKRMLFDRGIPDPFTGEWPERALRHIEQWKRRSATDGPSWKARDIQRRRAVP